MCLAVLMLTAVPSLWDLNIRHLTVGYQQECAKQEVLSPAPPAAFCPSYLSLKDVSANSGRKLRDERTFPQTLGKTLIIRHSQTTKQSFPGAKGEWNNTWECVTLETEEPSSFSSAHS